VAKIGSFIKNKFRTAQSCGKMTLLFSMKARAVTVGLGRSMSAWLDRLRVFRSDLLAVVAMLAIVGIMLLFMP
jgi:hypothetical protein